MSGPVGRPGDAGPVPPHPDDDLTDALQGTALQVRAAMADAADGIRSPGLLARVHRQARRRRRVKVLATLSAAGVAAAAASAVGLATLGPAPDQDAAQVAVAPAEPTRAPDGGSPTGPPDAGSPTGAPSGRSPAGPAPSAATSSPSRPSPSPAGHGATPSRTPPTTGPRSPASAGAAWREDFDAAPRAGTAWLPYTEGGTNAWTTFSGEDVTARDGSLRLAVRYDGTGYARAGGARSAVRPEATGRWEVRWRAGTGSGAIGVLVLAADDGRYPLNAVLNPPAGTLTVSDDLTGQQRTVQVDARAFHRLAVTVTPASVTWQLDGATVASWTSRTPRPPLWPALQADSLPQCRGVWTASCGGPAAPSQLEVDWIAYSPA